MLKTSSVDTLWIPPKIEEMRFVWGLWGPCSPQLEQLSFFLVAEKKEGAGRGRERENHVCGPNCTSLRGRGRAIYVLGIEG